MVVVTRLEYRIMHGCGSVHREAGAKTYTISAFSDRKETGSEPSASSHKWEAYRRRRFGRFSRRERRSYLEFVREKRATRKIGQSAIGPPGWLEKGSSASLLVRYVSQQICSSLTPSIQTLLKPTVCLPLMRRCTRRAGTNSRSGLSRHPERNWYVL